MNFLFVAEAGIFFLFLICLFHAHYGKRLYLLIATVAFGFLLELISYYQFHAYNYGSFSVVMLNTPLAVVLGWSLIIYTSMQVSDKLGLNDRVKPLLDALLALDIDFLMDAVATRAGFWRWNIATQFFGVPYDNFFAWVVAIASFSFFVRLLWYRDKKAYKLMLAVTLSLACSAVLNEVWTMLPARLYGCVWWTLFLLLAFVVVLKRGKIKMDNCFGLREFVIVLVPASYFALFFFIFIYTQAYREIPSFMFIAILVSTAGILIRLLPFVKGVKSLPVRLKSLC